MGRKKTVLSYIDTEMSDSYKKEAVKEYIGSLLAEISKRQEADVARVERKASVESRNPKSRRRKKFIK